MYFIVINLKLRIKKRIHCKMMSHEVPRRSARSINLFSGACSVHQKWGRFFNEFFFERLQIQNQ